jgi:beta-lactamase class A
MPRRLPFPIAALGALLLIVAVGGFVVIRYVDDARAASTAAANTATASTSTANSANAATAPTAGAASTTAGASTPSTSPTSAATSDAESAAAEMSALRARVPAVNRQASLDAALAAFAGTVPAEFAVAVVDHRSGTAYTYNGNQPFPTASVVKVDILVALALQAQDAGRSLTSDEQSLADAMIRYSDNDAASSLWWEIGADGGLQAANARLGLTQTVPGDDGYWGLTTTTVADQVRLLGAIYDPNGPLAPSRTYILSLMENVSSDQAWGISAAADPGESVALKNGWLDNDDGSWMVNSIGLVSGTDADVTIVILTDGDADMDSGITTVEQLATMTRTELAW